VGAREAGLEAVLLDPLAEYNVACPKIRSLEELLPLLPGRP